MSAMDWARAFEDMLRGLSRISDESTLLLTNLSQYEIAIPEYEALARPEEQYRYLSEIEAQISRVLRQLASIRATRAQAKRLNYGTMRVEWSWKADLQSRLMSVMDVLSDQESALSDYHDMLNRKWTLVRSAGWGHHADRTYHAF